MKQNIFAALGSVAFSLILFVSCSKSNDHNNSSNNNGGTGGSKITGNDSVALGYWFGSFDGSINQSMLFTSNGVVKVYDFYYHPTSTDTTIAYDGTGYWSVSGNKLTIVDSFPNGEKFTSVNIINTTANPATYTDSVTGDVYKKQ